MKNKLIAIAGAALLTLAMTQTSQASTIVGNIGFSGSGVLNTTDANTASTVTSWNPISVESASGNFVSPAYVNIGDGVTLSAPWNFNSGAIANFWSVDGFVFNLTSSYIASQSDGFLNVKLFGTVTGHGYTVTDFYGTCQIGNPAADGASTFTTRLSFGSVPDGGATVMLLGIALSGIGLLRKKLVA